MIQTGMMPSGFGFEFGFEVELSLIEKTSMR